MKGDSMAQKTTRPAAPTLKTLPKRTVTEPSKKLDTFASPRPGRAFEIRFETEEFTCLCPMTGQPDFAHLTITYVPDQLCVESKSLKLYLWSYRNEGAFHEAVTNKILDDLVEATRPQWLKVEGDFLIRGGIRTLVVAEHGKRP
ncbi:MAG TPA: preQ(1) synthase [Holophaga sp.]|nr:preQ(1) synthase [Holophaga sp.]HPS66785.1 preQ(1) synthase [Holophaga sp.]